MAATRIIWKLVLDFLILACAAFPLLVLTLWVEPYERGYFTDDTSLRLPYKEEQISVTAISVSGFSLIVATVLLVEIVRDKAGKGVGEKFVGDCLVPGWLWESYKTIGIFVFGAVCQQMTADFAKPIIGRLRPHFFDLCGPIPTSGSGSSDIYVNTYRCSLNLDRPELLKDVKLSFPSAHASFAMYCAVFFIFYIQVKGKWRGSKLLRHVFQLAVLIGAWYVGLTRIVDHMHHWTDVAAGYAIGASYGCLVFIFVFKPKKYSELPTHWEEPAIANTLPRAALAR